MKKYLYTLLFMAVALFGTTTLVSCGGDDDDFPGGGGSDKPAVTKIYVCAANVSQAVLDLYDVQLTLHNGESSKVVKIDKANGQALNGTMGKTEFKAYRFIYDNVDGNKGVDYIEAKVTPKAEAEKLIKAMNPEDVAIFLAGTQFVNEEFNSNGNYSFEGLSSLSASDFEAKTLLTVHPDTGIEIYKGYCDKLQSLLSKKRPGM